jgi:hypothetical protein
MTVLREELLQLIEQLPDDEVPAVLAVARSRAARPAVSDRPWPPAFFGSIKHAKSGRTDIARNVDDYLAESGFGRDFRG